MEIIRGDTYDSWHTVKNNEFSVNRTGRYVVVIENNDTNETNYQELKIVLTNAPKLQEGMVKLDINEEQVDENEQWEYSYYDGITAYVFEAARVQIDGDVYMWIPRFAYNLQDSQEVYVKFLKGNSNIPTDDKTITIDENEWQIPSVFTNSTTGQEYRGIWVKTDSINTNIKLPNVIINDEISEDDIINVI